MATTEMNCLASGGGKSAIGQKSVTLVQGTNNIDCGFIPSRVMHSLTIGGVYYVIVYDSDVSTTQFHLYHNYGGTPTDAGMVSIGAGALLSNVGSLSNGKMGFAIDLDAPSISSGINNFCYLAVG